jgi:CheY-like chemotaxis protein
MKRILAIDDSPEILTLVCLVLSARYTQLHSPGYPEFEVVTATDGLTGINLFDKDGPFELVITDLMISGNLSGSDTSGIDGHEIAQHIRQQEEDTGKRTRILLLSALSLEECIEKYPEIQWLDLFDADFRVPFSTQELGDVVKKLVQGERTSDV